MNQEMNQQEDLEKTTNLSYGLDTQPIKVADAVILAIAKQSLAEVQGFHSLSPRFRDEFMDGINATFGRHTLPGINIKHRRECLEINVYVKALFGYNLITMAKTMQAQIRQDLKNRFDLNDVQVDIHVESIVEAETTHNTSTSVIDNEE